MCAIGGRLRLRETEKVRGTEIEIERERGGPPRGES